MCSSYYKVVVFIDPLQGLYAILLGDTVYRNVAITHAAKRLMQLIYAIGNPASLI